MESKAIPPKTKITIAVLGQEGFVLAVTSFEMTDSRLEFAAQQPLQDGVLLAATFEDRVVLGVTRDCKNDGGPSYSTAVDILSTIQKTEADLIRQEWGVSGGRPDGTVLGQSQMLQENAL